jgi:Secretion system C-terminal sorting domain
MSRLLLLAVFLFAAVFANAQSVCMQVVSSLGSSGSYQDKHFAWTMGELITPTFSGFARHFTQGFHQPDACVSVSTDNVDLAAWGIEAYPNPTASFLQIRFVNRADSWLNAAVFDALGRLVSDNIPLGDSGHYTLDCQQWKAGLYVLRLRDQRSQAYTTLRFLKI